MFDGSVGFDAFQLVVVLLSKYNEYHGSTTFIIYKRNMPHHIISPSRLTSSIQLGPIHGGYAPDFTWHEDSQQASLLPHGVLYWQTRGSAEITINETTVCLQPGVTLAIAPGTRAGRLAIEPLDHAWMHWRVSGVWRWQHSHRCLPADETLSRLWTTWCDSAQCPDVSPQPTAATLVHIAAQALGMTTIASGDHTVQALLTAWEANDWPPISIADLGRHLDCHPKHAARRFRQAVGQPLGRFLNHRRIEAAAHSLLQEGAHIEQVAEQFGYADRFHFSRQFKAVMGEAPMRWRRRHELNQADLSSNPE